MRMVTSHVPYALRACTCEGTTSRHQDRQNVGPNTMSLIESCYWRAQSLIKSVAIGFQVSAFTAGQVGLSARDNPCSFWGCIKNQRFSGFGFGSYKKSKVFGFRVFISFLKINGFRFSAMHKNQSAPVHVLGLC